MIFRCSLLAAALATLATAQSPDFEKEVWPILEQACVDCHGAPARGPDGRLRKPRGGLRMDGKDWFLKGGFDGPVVVAGKPKASPLWQRISAPAADPDLMPPDGPRLGDAQLDVVKRWIEGGAGFGDWRGAEGPEKKPARGPAACGSGAARLALLAALAEGVTPAAAAAITKAAGEDARITPVVPGNPLLRVEFPGAAAGVDDRRLRRLSIVSSHVTQLLAGDTAITGGSLKTIAGMKRLTHLDLHGTAITSRELKHLAALTELRYLNLHGTEIDDEALITLIKLPELEALYVWNTNITEEGAARLRMKLPRCRVSARLGLPDPPKPAPDAGRRRRRK